MSVIGSVVLSVVVGGLAAFVVAFLVGRSFQKRASQLPTLLDGNLARVHYPCYRCGEVEGDAEYMGLHYCQMCRMVVSAVYAGVRHDPPFGFPGSPGYLDFPGKPVEEEKKEA